MMRNILAVLVGMIVGMGINMAFLFLNVALHPMPSGVTFEDAEGMVDYISTLPLQAFFLVLVAHLGQAFVGGWVAARISANHPMAVALIVGSLSLLGGFLNMMQLPHPWWMWIEIPFYLVVARVAANLEIQRRVDLASAG